MWWLGPVFIVGALVLFWRVLVSRRKAAAYVAKIKENAERIDRSERKGGYDRDYPVLGRPADLIGAGGIHVGNVSQLAAPIMTGVGVLLLILGLLISFFSVFVTVPTRDIGVKTTFGAPTGSLPNGAHFKAPWEDVTMMDGAIQTDTHNNQDCDKVRIAHQIVACANVYIIWQIKENSVDELFKDYREFQNIRNTLVDKKLQSTLNTVFEAYDPLAVNPTTGQSSAPELSVLSAQALDQMRQAAGDRITISDLKVTVLNFDDATQSKINALQGQVAQTRIAEQGVQTAQQQAKANDELTKSVSNNPYVLVSKCLDTLNEMTAKGQTVPAGFSCWPGGGSSLVLPAAGATK